MASLSLSVQLVQPHSLAKVVRLESIETSVKFVGIPVEKLTFGDGEVWAMATRP